MHRFNFTALALLTTLIVSTTFVAGISAQESASKAKAASKNRLPFYFGKLGVTNSQRQQLYSIQDSYESKLEALRKEMKDLLKKRDAEMQQLLTPGQKLRLQELKTQTVKDANKGEQPAPQEEVKEE
ncbi:hypothetical protein [Thalassoglobus polymorphus]|uniref:LTXXQ motif protein n=1 Tax=Thalassoglobus polymorphus TaxID=2527994 RepID=A0A517QU61_9PLAN|nr:hypothetical protein [Thalassoglobus polymorphus]QDT35179.1 hypothetical protein Mal48_44550 [Thalassoglobus polymorphus]